MSLLIFGCHHNTNFLFKYWDIVFYVALSKVISLVWQLSFELLYIAFLTLYRFNWGAIFCFWIFLFLFFLSQWVHQQGKRCWNFLLSFTACCQLDFHIFEVSSQCIIVVFNKSIRGHIGHCVFLAIYSNSVLWLWSFFNIRYLPYNVPVETRPGAVEGTLKETDTWNDTLNFG